MPPTYFPLRWESTGDQWWYASPIDWAAANGHYDLVRELLRIDGNHLIKLTSLRRIRRLETVWDDEEQFDDVAKCRSKVARKLFLECKSKGGKNSLIGAGYGGWLIYTAASAGDLSFVQQLLQRNPLLVFGEGEYGVTDILYAAARSKNCEVFRLVYDFALSPRFLASKGGEFEEHIGDIPSVYKLEMMNRAVHAAARGGNLKILKELLDNCTTDVLAYRDKQGATILHAAAGRGQVEVVKDLIGSYDITNSTDHQGNTALHVAAYRGQPAAVEALILANPSMISLKNNAGETFLHATVSGFQTPAFRRLDRQVKLMKQLASGKILNMEDIINTKNNDGRTALHMAIIGNVHLELVQLLMSAPSINVNVRDNEGMTTLDLLKQRPHSASSDILIRHLISAGGIFGSQDFTSRRAIATHLKMQGNGCSPGTSFRISDTEIFLYTGIDIPSDINADPCSAGRSSSSTELNQFDSTNENQTSSIDKKQGSVNVAAQRLKRVFHWHSQKEKKTERVKKSVDLDSVESCKKGNTSDGTSTPTPTPLRQRFSKPLPLPNNKRTLSVRSTQSSPTAKKKLASGLVHGVMQAMPQRTVPGRSRSSSFSKSSSISSPNSLDKQKGIFIDNDVAGPSCANQLFDDDGASNIIGKQGSKRLGSQYFCFGGSGHSVKTPVIRQRQNQNTNPSVISVA
ncbi:hypothetical protein EZV62_020051 [Acer yangbiense]|uniref:Uncharacterized protein n=1 Tax=Acer yangbiense TaxID=1000413 RepID=A0A5C7HDV0_9ROSI|nr:hypothetical protein EZV62_020051 [Acer yangbiense]